MRRFRLTKAAKILIMFLVVALVGGGAFAGIKTGFIKMGNDKKASASVDYDENGNVMNVDTENDSAINISLDEWIG